MRPAPRSSRGVGPAYRFPAFPSFPDGLLGQRLVHQIRYAFGDGERCGQPRRIDARGLHEPGVAAGRGGSGSPRRSARRGRRAPGCRCRRGGADASRGRASAGGPPRGTWRAARSSIRSRPCAPGSGRSGPASRCPTWCGSSARRSRGRSGRAADRRGRSPDAAPPAPARRSRRGPGGW